MISGSIRPRDPDLWVKSPADFELLSLMKELLFLKRPTYVKSQQGSRNSIFTFLKLVFQAWSSINFDLFLLGLDQLLTFGKFICLKYSSGRESPSHMLLAPASTIIIRPEDTVLRMLCLEPLFPSRSKSLAFCLKHQAKWDFKNHLLSGKSLEIDRWR